ncbi:8322_t:CDS:2 [Gigaspora margarita]|uniref:8322_t:CDS:1 n=1 Tax=Gigaspora margarita TaxID=4874 RepID=A0ABM8VZY0_GIGMA|nr:8322_t:CDS:2 [Gigaspora margarita]
MRMFLFSYRNLLIENLTDDESSFETPIINYFTEELAIRDIRCLAVPIEYPATSNEGVAYIFNINSSDPNAPFNDDVRKCTSVKICEYPENGIRNLSHCKVDENKDFFMINQPSELQTSIEAQTYV